MTFIIQDLFETGLMTEGQLYYPLHTNIKLVGQIFVIVSDISYSWSAEGHNKFGHARISGYFAHYKWTFSKINSNHKSDVIIIL